MANDELYAKDMELYLRSLQFTKQQLELNVSFLIQEMEIDTNKLNLFNEELRLNKQRIKDAKKTISEI